MTRPLRKNVGVIGLGIIGRRIADHLRRQGFSVFVWNRSPRAVPSFVGSPAELAQMCNYLQIFVGDDEALRQVVGIIAPQLTPRHIVIAHPTVAPETMREAAQVVARRGARLIEAPFTGSKMAAEKGQLVYYAAGDEAALAEVQPLLQASSKDLIYVGEIGTGSLLKVATNMVTAATVQSAAEAMAIVRRSGVPLEKFAEALRKNGSNSATLDMKVPQMIRGNYETHFSIKHMLKDMRIANDLAHQLDLDLPVAAVTRDRLLEEREENHGEDDYSAVARKFLPFQPSTEKTETAVSETEASSRLHEDPDFIEQQLSRLAENDAAANHRDEPALAPASGQMEAEIASEPAIHSTEPAEGEPLAGEPHDSLPAETIPEESEAAPEQVTVPDDNEPEERLGFFGRLLKRTTDY